MDNADIKRDYWWWIRRLVALVVCIFLSVQIVYVCRIVLFKYVEPSSTPYMRVEEERLNQENLAQIKYQWVDYDKISPYVIKATIAAEDAKFMTHHGLRWSAIRAAIRSNIFHAKTAPGGSTLTQQTVKNLFLTHERSYWRKAEEIMLAPVVEMIWGKKRILEIYLNIAEYGDGIFGIEAAAKHYYKTTAAKLNKNQAVWLTSILINPKQYQDKSRTDVLNKRIQRISYDMNRVKIPE